MTHPTLNHFTATSRGQLTNGVLQYSSTNRPNQNTLVVQHTPTALLSWCYSGLSMETSIDQSRQSHGYNVAVTQCAGTDIWPIQTQMPQSYTVCWIFSHTVTRVNSLSLLLKILNSTSISNEGKGTPPLWLQNSILSRTFSRHFKYLSMTTIHILKDTPVHH